MVSGQTMLELFAQVSNGSPQVQTAKQRIANEKYAKQEAAKRGKPESERKTLTKKSKSPISPGWLYLLGFVVFGGLLFELL